jgi:hypothetical protein
MKATKCMRVFLSYQHIIMSFERGLEINDLSTGTVSLICYAYFEVLLCVDQSFPNYAVPPLDRGALLVFLGGHELFV